MGYLYTTLQFVLLGLIFFTPPFLPESIAGQVVLAISVLFGLWAVWAFRHTRINVFPYLRKGARLVRTGPYRYVRHPMYTAVLLFILAYWIDRPNVFYSIYLGALLLVMVLKIRFEEIQLKARFDQYEAQFYNTYRIVPCIY